MGHSQKSVYLGKHSVCTQAQGMHEALEEARPWCLPLGMCSLEAQMLLSILVSPLTQYRDVLAHRPLPHPIVRDVQELQPWVSGSACVLPSCARWAGQEGKERGLW